MTAGANPNVEQGPKSAVRFVPVVARILLGLGFTVFGLNGFLHFIPEPKTPMPEGAAAFAGALFKTGYMFPLVSGTQLVAGVLLLVNVFVPLALVLLMPVLVNIIAFHIFLAPAPGAFAPGIVFTLLELYLVWVYRKAYRSMLVMRTH
jgi:uncharacterized membrane protein YphA (DoxX/SURF4 family)